MKLQLFHRNLVTMHVHIQITFSINYLASEIHLHFICIAGIIKINKCHTTVGIYEIK